MQKVIIVGSGVGGSVVANELQGDFQVTILEAGNKFKPFSVNLDLLEKFKKTGLFFDERLIQLLFKSMNINKINNIFSDDIKNSPIDNEDMIIVHGSGTGGTSTISTGSCLRADDSLLKVGINLDKELKELKEEINITTDHQQIWRESTRRIFSECQEMGLKPFITPKMGNHKTCVGCGHCVLGCPNDVKWDSRNLLYSALDKGANLITNCKVERVISENDQVRGVEVKKKFRKKYLSADKVVLAAGGLGTPQILENSGIHCTGNLFVDPVLCLAAKMDDCKQNQEIAMPFIIEREGYIISPYFDHLSFFFNKEWNYKSSNIMSLMIKLADSGEGNIQNNKLTKKLNKKDSGRLKEAINICLDIYTRLGIRKDDVFFGSLNAGHPGGMMPLSKEEAKTLHPKHLPNNLYVADSSLLPSAAGKPLILTIMALAKRISKKIKINM